MTDPLIEEMRSMPGYPNYLVSDTGQIYSKRVGVWWRLKSSRASGKYLHVGLSRNGKVSNVSVHVCVLRAFRGPRPEGQQCRHLNGNMLDNNLTNLCWGTPAENVADTERHGRTRRGDQINTTKLTPEKVKEIRRLRALGVPCSQVAKRFDISISHAHSVGRFQKWRYIR